MTLNKDRIKTRFAKAAATYDDQAIIQHKVADRLLTLLVQHTDSAPKRALEIGCCTGLLTSRLANLYREMDKLFVNDLVPEFKQVIVERVAGTVGLEFLAGDIESVTLPDNLNLVISSSTFHWLDDPASLFAKLAARMAPESTLAFAMYSRNNLWELREITGIGLQYYDPAELQEMVAKHFKVLAFEEEQITFKFQAPLDILHHLRETGVNSLIDSQWSRTYLSDFVKRYQSRFTEQNSVRLTYHPVYCIARKTGA